MSDVRDMVGKQPLCAPQHLPGLSQFVEQHQPVGRGHSHSVLRHVDLSQVDLSNDAVDAENMLVLYMAYALQVGVQQVEAMIKVADPDVSSVVQSQGRDVAVLQQGGRRRQQRTPALVAVSRIKVAAGYQQQRVAAGKNLLRLDLA